MKINKNFVFAALMTVVLFLLFRNILKEHNSFLVIGVIFFLSYPYKIGANIYSLWGGFNDEGGVYSLCGLVQVAETEADSVLGISFYQKAYNEVYQWMGISFYQESYDAGQLLGFSFCQKADNESFQGLGFSVYREGGDIYGWSFYLFSKKRYTD